MLRRLQREPQATHVLAERLRSWANRIGMRSGSRLRQWLRSCARQAAHQHSADDDGSLLLLRGLQSCNHVKDICPRALSPWLPCEKNQPSSQRDRRKLSRDLTSLETSWNFCRFRGVQSDQLCHNAAVGPQAGWRRQRSRRHRRRHGQHLCPGHHCAVCVAGGVLSCFVSHIAYKVSLV